ncbi:hypothetical protein [Deinococcus hopiensis]|uniref:Uncharacterized protein n=1 Tax=Deinococcus hopiensis KR-140 TaxID=695939 RepID=A0A1W1UVB2_9DEIO|nr:hypothetical protein [Deinococcus hopiensis]SMB85085.1 hypothetical protein SAMN00790413_03255 [Deinococcus hopiensis KR-140]
MTEEDLITLVLSSGNPRLHAPFEELVYRWLTGPQLPERRKRTVLRHLIRHARTSEGSMNNATPDPITQAIADLLEKSGHTPEEALTLAREATQRSRTE